VCGAIPLRAIRPDHGRTFLEALQARGIAHGTILNHLKVLKAMLSVAVDTQLIKDNPLATVKVPAEQGNSVRKSRVPFSHEDVATILEKLPTDEGPARRWIPVIGLYTGMRIEEISQLAPADIREESYRDAGGVARKTYVFYVTEEGEGQGIKNRSSHRRVPVHPELVRMGLISFVKGAKGSRVFSELKADKYGREAATFGKWFTATFLRKTCGINSPRKTFHSFRHLFKDVMRDAGVHEQVSDALTGHTTGSESRKYGDDFYPLRPLVEAVAKFEMYGE